MKKLTALLSATLLSATLGFATSCASNDGSPDNGTPPVTGPTDPVDPGEEDPVDPGPTCTTGEGGRIDVGNSNSFFNRVIDPNTNETTECSFKAQFNDGSIKEIYITPDGTGQTVAQTDSCGNISTVPATEQDTFLAPEMLDQFFENIVNNPDPSIPGNNIIIQGVGETNEPTNATHVGTVRSFVCQY